VLSRLSANARAYARRIVPDPAVHWLRRKIREREIDRLARLRPELLALHGSFTASQLIAFLRGAGVRQNGILFVQCSYNDLVTYVGTAYELVSALIDFAGRSGTLLMPAYSSNMWQTPCRPFDARREPTNAGIVAELFRREEGVIRSVHPRHSICGIGPRATELLSGHEDCVYADGEGSPFDRIRKLQAQSICLGMPPGFTSFCHWVEDIQPDKYPIRAHDGPMECELTNAEGQKMVRLFYRRRGGQRSNEALLGRKLPPPALQCLQFHGIQICKYEWPMLATELMALRDQGIVPFR